MRVSKSGSPQAYQVATQQPSMAPAIAPMPQEGSSDQNINDPVSHPGAVTSPMVGTVYMQAEPGAEPFISVGSSVSEGHVADCRSNENNEPNSITKVRDS